MDDNTNSPPQWHVGQKCMAPFSGDGLLYRACVQAVARSPRGRVVATVRYSGFTADEDEVVDVRKLEKRPTRARNPALSTDSNATTGNAETTASLDVSSPLKYISEEERLRTKYGDLFDDSGSASAVGRRDVSVLSPPSSVTSPSPSSSSTSSASVRRGAKKRKTPVAIGGDVKEISVTQPKRSPVSIGSCASPRLPARQASDERDSFGFLDEGFSREELEKPFFPGVSGAGAGAKVPLLLSPAGSEAPIQVPATLNRYLRDYQREGVRFLYERFRRGKGAILGDDMGLGKTVQVLALLSALLRKTGTREDCQRSLPEFLQKKLKSPGSSRTSDVFLVICPTSVLFNWLDEFETWTYCTVGKYHGKERQETLWKAMKGKLDVVITSYETYRIYMESLLKVKWTAVIVDEVHKIKESGSQITQALKEVNTKRRFGLTGTALQNKLSELWCVLDWANPGCLGSQAEFKACFEEPMSKGQKFHASKRELAESRRVTEDLAKMRDGWMIRRTKALISHQLPTKEEKVVFCKLTSLQLSIYRTLLESDDMKLVLRQKEQCDCGSQETRARCCYKCNSEGEKVKALTLGFMSLLIKVANHVALLTPDVSMSARQRAKARRYCDLAFSRHPQFVSLSREARFCTLSDPSYCGKMQILEKLLGVFRRDGSKVLLFSYYTQLLNILEMYLKTTDYVYRRLDGRTPAQDRQKYVHEFNTDSDIFLFLISTKAGGLGLNLTGANVVVIFDPNWNPTFDLQAQDRAYRIGQHRDVRVYRLVTMGSIEENMYLRQVYKQQLASAAVTAENPMRYFTAVAGDKQQQGELFGLHNMFALRPDTSCLTKDLIQRHIKTEEGITMAKYTPPSPPMGAPNQSSTKGERMEFEANRDSDSSHSDADLPSPDEGLRDDHGMASQLLSNSESEAEEEEEEEEEEEKEDARQGGEDRCISSSTRSRARPGISRTNQVAVGAGPADRGTISASGSDDGSSEVGASRDKAIRRRGGRVERRPKRQSAAARRLTTEGTRRSEVARVQPVGHGGVGSSDGHQGEADRKSTKEVDDIFRECGVAFVHSNAKIVGGSRVEDHVSNIAMRDVYDLGLDSQQPANYNVPTLAESASDSPAQEEPVGQSDDALRESLLGQSQPSSHRVRGTTVLFGQTPRGIRRNQFEAMAKTLGHSTGRSFARHVLSLSGGQHLGLLRDHYASRYPELDLARLCGVQAPSDERPLRGVDDPRRGSGGGVQRGVYDAARERRSGLGAPQGRRSARRSKERGPASDRRPTHSTREATSKPRRVQPCPAMSNSSGSDAGEEATRRSPAGLTASKATQSSRRRGGRRDVGDGPTKITREGAREDSNSSSDSADGEPVPSSAATGRLPRPRNSRRERGTEDDRGRRAPAVVASRVPAVRGKRSPGQGAVSRHITDSDEDWLAGDDSLAGRRATRPNERLVGATEDSLPGRATKPSERPDGPTEDGLPWSPPRAQAARQSIQDESLSFLDDIFLAEPSKRPARPPPKNKSPRGPPRRTTAAEGELSDWDVEAEEDLLRSRGRASSVGSGSIPDTGDGSAMWRRNSRFASRQSLLDRAAAEAKLDERSVFEKYAESFVPNEHFGKRGRERERTGAAETIPTADGSADA